MEKFTIRWAELKDAEAILRIYEPYILNTAVTFEYDRIPLTAFAKRMKKIMLQFPWLVCCAGKEVIGYAYCSSHRERAAFAWDCDCAVYIEETYGRKGIASALYQALFGIVRAQGYYTVYALICTDNKSSIAFHEKHGFNEVCIFYDTAYKLGKWRNLLVMEKKLRTAKIEPEPVIPVKELNTAKADNEIKTAEKILNIV